MWRMNWFFRASLSTLSWSITFQSSRMTSLSKTITVSEGISLFYKRIEVSCEKLFLKNSQTLKKLMMASKVSFKDFSKLVFAVRCNDSHAVVSSSISSWTSKWSSSPWIVSISWMKTTTTKWSRTTSESQSTSTCMSIDAKTVAEYEASNLTVGFSCWMSARSVGIASAITSAIGLSANEDWINVHPWRFEF